MRSFRPPATDPAALVVDLTGYVDDVLYALELANLQLEEFRVMDQRLFEMRTQGARDGHGPINIPGHSAISR